MVFFDGGYSQLRIIPPIVLIDAFVAFRYPFRTLIFRKVLLTLSAAIEADQRGFGEIVIPNKMPTTEHTKGRNSVLYYRVDLALEILPPSLNVTRGRKNTGGYLKKIKKNNFTGKEQSENDSVFL